jgi:hypothetical protein
LEWRGGRDLVRRLESKTKKTANVILIYLRYH